MPRTLSPRLRGAALALALGLGAFALVGQIGNSALAKSSSAARGGNQRTAESQARKARDWAPWSAEPWRRLGEAQRLAGDLPAARASFRHAIAKDPRDWSLWFELALASQGRAQRAAVTQARRLDPLSPEITAASNDNGKLTTR